MKKSDIQVGVEYAIGREDSPDRGRCVEVGTFKDTVYGRNDYHGHLATKAGARFEILRADGSVATTFEMRTLHCAECGGEGHVLEPDHDFTDVMVQVPCLALGCVKGKVASRTEVPRVYWVELNKVRRLWADEVAAKAIGREREQRLEQLRTAASLAASGLVEDLKAQGFTSAAKVWVPRESDLSVTVRLSTADALRLAELLASGVARP